MASYVAQEIALEGACTSIRAPSPRKKEAGPSTASMCLAMPSAPKAAEGGCAPTAAAAPAAADEACLKAPEAAFATLVEYAKYCRREDCDDRAAAAATGALLPL